MAEQLLDKVILWTDDSEESSQARELLGQAGVAYEERTIDQVNTDDSVEPPLLQTYLYRYWGLTLIQALTQNRHMSFRDHLDLEKEQYLALANYEEGLRDLSPQGIPRLWPQWSVRRRTS